MPISTKISEETKKLSDLAGSWKMGDKETKEFMGELKKGWKR